MDFLPVWDARFLLLEGFVTTLQLSAIAVILGTAVGMLVAGLRTIDFPPLTVVLRFYVEIFRGTPLLMQLFFVYFGFPMMGIEVDRLAAAIVAISLYTGAYVAEVFRAGIEAVPGGQLEAATALGISKMQRLWYVIAPQGFRIALPPLIGVYVAVIKDTSLATIIGYSELMRTTQDLVIRTNRPIEVFLVAGFLYFIICYPISKLSLRLERRMEIRM